MAQPKKSRRSAFEFQIYYALSFIIFLPMVLLGRLLPRTSASEQQSILQETRGRANQVVPFIFMA